MTDSAGSSRGKRNLFLTVVHAGYDEKSTLCAEISLSISMEYSTSFRKAKLHWLENCSYTKLKLLFINCTFSVSGGTAVLESSHIDLFAEEGRDFPCAS